jgi:lysophospholipase
MKTDESCWRALPPGAEIGFWRSADDWRHRRLDWAQRAGAVGRGSLVFAGGRGDFIEKYLEPLAHWHERGWNVCSFDWRGQGGSRGDIVGGHLDSFDPLVADGAGFLSDWMRATPPPHVAVAHSMGGHVLLRILAEHRPALAAAVLVAPMIGINTAPVPAALGRAAARVMVKLGQARRGAWREARPEAPIGRIRRANLTSCARRYADEAWWKRQEPGFELGPPSWGWLNAAYRSAEAFQSDALASVATSILILGTDRDRLVSPVGIRQAAAALPGAELTMFRDAAHELLRESDPARSEAMARIDEFLGRRAAA